MQDVPKELKDALVILLSNKDGLSVIEDAVKRWGTLSISTVNKGGNGSSAYRGNIVIDLDSTLIAFEFEFKGSSRDANAIIERRVEGLYPSPDGDHPFYTKFSFVRDLAHEISHSAYSRFSAVIDDEADTIRRENLIMKSIHPRAAQRVCHSCWVMTKDVE